MSQRTPTRVLLKLSGEAFNRSESTGVDSDSLLELTQSIQTAREHGVQIAIVVGAGNFWRGRQNDERCISAEGADYMGIIATCINAIALKEACESQKIPVILFSALGMQPILPVFDQEQARRALSEGKVVILAAGTGKPFVTTDSAASMRAVQLQVDCLLKASTVDGIYDTDPKLNPKAKRYDHLSYAEVISKKLGVMDLGAFEECKAHQIAIRIFNGLKPGALTRALLGFSEGSLVDNGGQK